ncbi:hypothetical protein [Kribbella sp. NPDC004875]|uniref:hypothetical protein n=1 Tax=Kribbella sp. NPDC004875 TaxID=3364107 RepID=UPI0036908505
MQAVLLSGSTARGTADRWSDVEIGVFWQTPPEDFDRSDLAASGGALDSRLFGYDEEEQVWCDDLYLGAPGPEGLLVEVVHTLTESTEQLLDSVLVAHSPDPVGLNVADGLVDGIAFHGAELIDGWKMRATSYPRKLAVAVVESAGVIDHFWRWEMLVDRRNPVLFAGLLSSASQQLLTMLLALNRRYGPKPKWLAHLSDTLAVAPVDLGERLRQVFTVEPRAAAHSLAELVEETFTLIEAELPEVDVDRLRTIFRHRRPPLDGPPGARRRT